MTMVWICSSTLSCTYEAEKDVGRDARVLCRHQPYWQFKSTFADRFAIGIIDKDKVELGYIGECDVIAQTRHLTLMKHREKCQFLITVAPAIDRFVLDCSKDCGVNTEDYGIPSELKAFTEISKSVTSNTDKRFKALFAAIKDNQEVSALRNVLRYLSIKKYNADLEQLKQLFQ